MATSSILVCTFLSFLLRTSYREESAKLVFQTRSLAVAVILSCGLDLSSGLSCL